MKRLAKDYLEAAKMISRFSNERKNNFTDTPDFDCFSLYCKDGGLCMALMDSPLEYLVEVVRNEITYDYRMVKNDNRYNPVTAPFWFDSRAHRQLYLLFMSEFHG